MVISVFHHVHATVEIVANTKSFEGKIFPYLPLPLVELGNFFTKNGSRAEE